MVWDDGLNWRLGLLNGTGCAQRGSALKVSEGRKIALVLAAGVAVGIVRLPQNELCAQTPGTSVTAASPGTSSAAGGGAQSPAAQKLDSMLAEATARVALMDLRINESPQPADFRVAMMLLKMAERYAPADVELLRRRIEAASNAGDEDSTIEGTRRLLKLEPDDTVAALRLISADKIGKLQTAEERLAAYDRFTGDAAGGLDPSIRSRLALDAALLCQERGDQRGYLDRLKQAAKLDSTNKDAALLVYNAVGEATEDGKVRAEALSNLLYADPLDPNVHMRLAREFGKAGAFKAAERFHKNARTIVNAGLANPPFMLVVEAGVLEWLNSGPEPVYKRLRESLAARRAQAAKLIKERESQLLDTSTMSKPEDEHLRMDLEPLRLCTALSLHDMDSAKATLDDLARAIAKNTEYAKDPLRRPREISEDDAVHEAQGQLFTMDMWRVAVGIDVDKIEKDVAEARKGMDEDDVNVVAFDAMLAAREGKGDEALAILNDPPQTTEWTEYARALALEAKGDKAGELGALREAAKLSPLSVLGGYAWQRATELSKDLGEAKGAFGGNIAAMEKLGASIPGWVDEMVENPRSFEVFELEIENATAPVHEPLKAKLTLQNVSRVPLGLGAGRTLNSRVLFSPALSVRGMTMRDFVFPEVMDLERRLRLKPGEAIHVDVPLEIGRTGWTVQTVSGVPCQMRWRALQGFEVKEDGMRTVGPGCLEAMSAAIVRLSLAESRMSYDELVKRVGSAIEPEFGTLILGVRSSLVMGTRGIAEDEKRKSLVVALAARYPKLSPKVRSLVVAVMPPSAEMAELAPLDAAIREEKDAEVLAIAIVTRCAKADDPLVQSARSTGDAELAKLVDLQLERVGSGGTYYATKGTGMVDALVKYTSGGSEIATPPTAPAKSK